MSLGLLAWLGAEHRSLPTRIAVDTQDRYLLDLLVRHCSEHLGRGARVREWSRSLDGQLRAQIEEVPLFGPKPPFLILGAPKGWVRGVRPSRTAYVVAQQPGARLSGEAYHHRHRSLILRVLVRLLNLPWTVKDLLRVDWAWARGWADFEPLLARGKLLDWSVSDLMKAAAGRAAADVFALIRDGDWWAIHFLARRYGRDWLHRHLIEFTVQVAACQLLQAAGAGQRRIRESLELPDWQAEQVAEAAIRTDPVRLQYFANRLQTLDSAITRVPAGLDLLLLSARI